MTKPVSVALATHNGGRYLPEFLDSLLDQHLQPSELIASDDDSSDNTLEILEEFAAKSPFPVRIRRNPQALGVRANFEQAISLCAWPFIALADQDDVWHPHKLTELSGALSASDFLAAFSDANLVDEKLTPLGYTMWERVRFSPKEQQRLQQKYDISVLLKHHVISGATMAFHSRLRDLALPIPDGWPHDAWLALIAASRGGLVAINTPLISYRQHNSNTVGGKKKPFKQEVISALTLDRPSWYRREIALWHALSRRLESIGAPESTRMDLAKKIAHLERRSQLPTERWKRIPGVAREVLTAQYNRYARNWGSIAIDLLVR